MMFANDMLMFDEYGDFDFNKSKRHSSGSGRIDTWISPRKNPADNAEFFLKEYKTVRCPNPEVCPNRQTCACWHDEMDRRRDNGKYGRAPCARVKVSGNWLSPSRCSKGDSCGYSHTHMEQMYHPSIYKTDVCTHHRDGSQNCYFGYYCTHSHGAHELRVTSESKAKARAKSSKSKAKSGASAKRTKSYDPCDFDERKSNGRRTPPKKQMPMAPTPSCYYQRPMQRPMPDAFYEYEQAYFCEQPMIDPLLMAQGVMTPDQLWWNYNQESMRRSAPAYHHVMERTPVTSVAVPPVTPPIDSLRERYPGELDEDLLLL